MALAKAGHRITIITRRVPSDSALEEELIPGQVYVQRAVIEDINFINRFKKAFLLIEKGWISHLDNFIMNNQLDIMHVHDFKMVPTVVSVAKRRKIPVVADLHENMPAVFVARRSNFPALKKIRHSIVNNYNLWRWQESKKLKKCEKVIVVVPEAAERLKHYGLEKNKIVIVSNTEDETTFKFRLENADQKVMKRYGKSWMISYIGGIGPHRGVDTVINAMPSVISYIPNVKLVIVGARDIDREHLQNMINRIGIENYVEIIEWQTFDKVNSFMLASKVCLIPHKNFEHTQTTVPHKLFQAMICSRPVLVSNCKPLKRIIGDCNAGCIFKAEDSVDLGEKIIYMYKNPEKLKIMGQNGQRAALGKYSWRNDAKRLVEMYGNLEKKSVRKTQKKLKSRD